MLRIIFYLSVILLITSCGQSAHRSPEDVLEELESDTSSFDSVLAAQLGADNYGMRQYMLAFLKKGPNRSLDSAESAQLQRAHLDNITRLAEEGILVLAGPFLDDTEVRGIYIFAVNTEEEALQLARTDPAVQAGSLVLEFHPWYGSAAITEVYRIHNRITRSPI